MADVAMKYERQGFLNTGTLAVPVWTRIGQGIKEFADSLNPVVDETAYVDDVAATKTVTGYGPEWTLEFDVIKDGTLTDYIRAIGEGLETGADAETELVVFDLWELDEGTDECPCKKFAVAVKVDSIGGGAGGEKLTGSATLLGKGDPISGYFDVTLNEFGTSAGIS